MRIPHQLIHLLLIVFLFGTKVQAQHDHSSCHTAVGEKTSHHTAPIELGDMTIPDAELLNQYGKKVRLSELIKGKAVAMNFVFTTCTTICPPMGANFTHLKGMFAEEVARGDLAMISVSIDPVTDTPERLKNWSDKFKPGEGWTLLTGEQADVNALLKGLNVYTPLIEEHAPIILMGRQGDENWIRTNGLAAPAELKTALETYLKPTAETVGNDDSPELNYFTNVPLVNQFGEEMKLYEDLMKDKIVVVAPFFLRCQASCPVMSAMMKDLQDYFGEKIGKEIHLLSISVDPTHDTPERVKEYATSMEAKRGWYLLTGDKANVDKALYKLGNHVNEPDDHKNVIMIGNVATRLWKKANGLAPSKEIAEIVASVLRDEE